MHYVQLFDERSLNIQPGGGGGAPVSTGMGPGVLYGGGGGSFKAFEYDVKMVCSCGDAHIHTSAHVAVRAAEGHIMVNGRKGIIMYLGLVRVFE